MRQTSAAVDAAAGRNTGGTSHRVDRFVDRENDIRDARIVAVMNQQIAAARAAHAFDEPATAQLGEELLEEGQRNFLALGDFGKADRRTIAVAREIDHRHHGIAALGAEPHGFALATRGRIGSGGGSAALAAPRSRSSSATRARNAATSSSKAVSGRAIGSGISPVIA